MKVILRENVPHLGEAGELVDVKDGYARNYLIPHGLAYRATSGNKRRFEAEAKTRAKRSAAALADADLLVDELAKVELTFTAKSGEGEKLFGSITAADIAAKLGEEGYAIDKRSIVLEEPIKLIGIYRIPIKLHADVRGEVRVWVVKE